MKTQKLILDQSEGSESIRRAELVIDEHSHAPEVARALQLMMLIMGFEHETVDQYIDIDGEIRKGDDEDA